MCDELIKDYINALRKGNGYEWIAQNGFKLDKEDLIRIIKELDYAIWFLSKYYEPEEFDGFDICQYAANELESWYIEEE